MPKFIEPMHFKFKYLLLCSVAFLALVYSACVKKKVYPQEPQIDYKDFHVIAADSAQLTITFSDGDGDIGSDGTQNMFINYYYKDSITGKYTGYYNPTINDTVRFNYTIKKPADSYQGKSISGEISVVIKEFRHSKKAKNLKYTIYIKDEAGHKSNLLSTPELTVP
jgi:hypothetical protein